MSIILDDHKQIEELFNVSFSGAVPALFKLHGHELTHIPACQKLIDQMKQTYQVNSPIVAASLFSKAYGRMLCSVLYAMSFLNKQLPASLQHIELSINDQGKPQMIFNHSDLLDCRIPRNTWRDEIMTELFASHLYPVFQTLQQFTGLNQAILWENALVYIRHFYNHWIKEAVNSDLKLRLEADYYYVTSLAEPHIYGTHKTNPLNIEGRFIEHPVQSNEQLRIRESCCLRYFMPDGKRCTVCPGLDDCDREALFKAKN
jgi:ferric iron reductase protein FhuF